MLQETDQHSGLQHSLKQRHMTMIALGGVIGAGLFVGSGVVIQSAGPAAIISFLSRIPSFSDSASTCVMSQYCSTETVM